ncbi:MAG TPA: glycosyltransferase family 2 protein [Pseudomonadales bacterium]|nr:glycosyltransferase family 2 protein [Pseudomonadales bacterium]
MLEKTVRQQRQTVSFIVPFHDEATCLPALLKSLGAYVRDAERAWPVKFDAIFVDDGSTDGSRDVLCAAVRAQEPRLNVRVIRLSRNFGKEAALTIGLNAATSDAVVLMDADLQHPPELVDRFLDGWLTEGVDVVYGYKDSVADEGRLRRLARRAYYRAINASIDAEIPPNAGDFRLLTRRAYEALRTLPERQRLMKGLYSWIGFTQKGVPFRPAERAAGKTKFSAVRLALLALDGITSFSILPLRLATWFGVALALISGGYGVWTIFEYFFLGIAVPGYPTLITTIAFIGAAQLIFLGIIGEYVGKVLIEVKGRPVALVESDERLEARAPLQVALPPPNARVENFSRPVVEG